MNVETADTPVEKVQTPVGRVSDSNLLVLDSKVFLDWSKRSITTSDLLWGAWVVISVCSAIMTLVIVCSVETSWSEIHTVCVNAAPSVEAVQKIRAGLADLSSNELDLFLAQPQGPQFDKISQDCEQDREQISDQLVIAAQNLFPGDSEQASLSKMVHYFAQYEAKITAARTLYLKQDIPDALIIEREADAIMHNELLPTADQLDQLNTDRLNAAFISSEIWTDVSLVALFVSTGFLLVVLIATQLWLKSRFKRVFNLPLVAATAITLIFSGRLALLLLISQEYVRVAAKDCFDSIHVLLQAKAYGSDAIAAEGRWLLDTAPLSRSLSAGAFQLQSVQVASIGNNSYGSLIATFQHGPDDGETVQDFSGCLARELKNITFEGEKDAAIETLKNWGIYEEADKKMRELDSTDHQGAVTLGLSYAQDGSHSTFNEFSNSLDQAYQINEYQFGMARDRGLATLYGADGEYIVLGFAIVGLSFAGLWPRLKEYRA